MSTHSLNLLLGWSSQCRSGLAYLAYVYTINFLSLSRLFFEKNKKKKKTKIVVFFVCPNNVMPRHTLQTLCSCCWWHWRRRQRSSIRGILGLCFVRFVYFTRRKKRKRETERKRGRNAKSKKIELRTKEDEEMKLMVKQMRSMKTNAQFKYVHVY